MNLDPLPYCPVCREPLVAQLSRALLVEASCRICGAFTVAREELLAWEQLTPRQRGLMAGVLRTRLDEHPNSAPLRVSPLDVESFAIQHGAALDTDASITRFLEAVAREAPSFGVLTQVADMRVWAARAYLWSRDVAWRWLSAMTTAGYVRQEAASGEGTALVLTMAGWAEFERRRRHAPESRSAFVASWGHEVMLGLPVKAICRAVRAAGLDPIVGSLIADRERITDSIEAGIRRSRLVVAEYTGARAGVYFESGLARGLGIPVIHCCHATWRTTVAEQVVPDLVQGAENTTLRETTWQELLHFDTRQFPHILWQEPTDLERQILERIRAWGLDLPVGAG